jgi:hypothetical protein
VGSRIDREFRTRLEKLGSTRVQAIVRVSGSPEQAAKRLRQAGMTVRHAYTLVPAVAVAGPAQTLLAVAGESWVLKVEEDKPVSRQTAKASARK